RIDAARPALCFFSSRRRHTRSKRDWSSDVCSSDLPIAATWSEASDVLGYDMAELVANDPEGLLDQTEYTQPALVAAGVAVWRTEIGRASSRERARGDEQGESSETTTRQATGSA